MKLTRHCTPAIVGAALALTMTTFAHAQTWSAWLNRSTPATAGEFETIAGFTADGTMPCAAPTAIQCRDKLIPSKVISSSTGQYTCDSVTGGK